MVVITGLISSANYNEDTSLPLGQVYFDAATCIKGLTGADIAGAVCDASTEGHAWDSANAVGKFFMI